MPSVAKSTARLLEVADVTLTGLPTTQRKAGLTDTERGALPMGTLPADEGRVSSLTNLYVPQNLYR